MRRHCPICGLPYYREPGYFVGAMIVNYAASILIVVLLYLVSIVLPGSWGASFETKLLAWFALTIVISLALMPHSRSFWLAMDYWLEPWQPEEPSGSLSSAKGPADDHLNRPR